MWRLELLLDGLITVSDRAIKMTAWLDAVFSFTCQYYILANQTLHRCVSSQGFGYFSDSSKFTKFNINTSLLYCNLSTIHNDKQTCQGWLWLMRTISKEHDSWDISLFYFLLLMETHASFISSLHGIHTTKYCTASLLYSALLYSTSLQWLWSGLSWHSSLLFTQAWINTLFKCACNGRQTQRGVLTGAGVRVGRQWWSRGGFAPFCHRSKTEDWGQRWYLYVGI